MDIISSLPDPILCHILSFLQTKFSVRTSVLATRWRFLWTSVRKLQFVGNFSGSKSFNGMVFSNLLDRVLLLHNGPIDTLAICPCDDNNIIRHDQIDAWVSTAVARNVQVLRLSDISESLLPQSCFECKTLVELAITSCKVSVKPGAVCLPKLKKLYLDSNYFEDDESLTNLVSGCWAIENLIIDNDLDGCNLVCCYVCSPTLKSLVLKFKVTCYMLDHEHKLMLDIPAVQYLCINDDISYIFWAEKLSSLVVADIKLSYGNNSEDEDNTSEDSIIQATKIIEEKDPEENDRRWTNMFQFVEKLSNAKSLTLTSSDSMKLLSPTFSIPAMRFHNLTKLILRADWHILTELLESAYKLEVLTIQKVEDELKYWREPKNLPKCLLSSLKYVYIFGFAGGEHELNMVRYILRHAKVLKRIKICSVSRHKDSKINILQQLSYFPRGSHKCRLTFV